MLRPRRRVGCGVCWLERDEDVSDAMTELLEVGEECIERCVEQFQQLKQVVTD